MQEIAFGFFPNYRFCRWKF